MNNSALSAYYASAPRREPRAFSLGEGLRIIGWRVLVTTCAAVFAVAAMRDKSGVARSFFAAVTVAIAVSPFAARTLTGERRRPRPPSFEAASARRRMQLRARTQRQVMAQATNLERMRAAQPVITPEVWRKTVEQFVIARIYPAVAYGVAPAERAQWLAETVSVIDAFLTARRLPRGCDAAAIVDVCVASATAAGWESWVTPGNIVAARRGSARVLFFCVDKATVIDKAALDHLHARSEAAGARCGVIVGVQPYPRAAVAHAKTLCAGLIRPAHVGMVLDWAARTPET